MKGLREHILAVETDDGPDDDARSWAVIGALTAAATAMVSLRGDDATAGTPVKVTLPWLPLRHLQLSVFVARNGSAYWEKRGLDVAIDRGFGSTKVCVPVDQGQYDFGLLDLRRHGGLRRARDWT